jgi:5'-AMP-activated protein kinase, catalytic alpha subunit
MEFVEGGDLFDAISNASKLSEDVTKQYFSQIVLGLEYLHSQGITHRDMKPENILIGEGGKIKIADFGLGNFFREEEKLRTACGSPCYAPPEMLNQ